MAEGGGPKKRFQYCLNPNSSKHFLCFRAIQGHSGGTLVDPTLQDNVLLPDDFAEYIHHVGNAHDMHSIIQGGFIPGRKSQKGQAVSVFFFKAVNPIYTNQDPEEVQYDLDKPRITVYENTWRVYQKYRILMQSEAPSKKRIAVLTNPIARIRSFSTLLAICIEKVVYMNTGEDLYCIVHQPPRLPRVVLTPNL